MNEVLNELNRYTAPHKNTEDVFAFASSLFSNFRSVFQEWESELRQLELVASLFDHVGIECVNDVAGLMMMDEDREVRGDAVREETR